MMSYCLPVWFRNEPGDRAKGSMTVVDTGEMVLGVTAGHVADRILECCDGGPERLCQVGSVDLPRDSFIARHSDLDLATFRLSASRLEESGRSAHTVLKWPPIAPDLGDVVLFGGYPGQYRRELTAQSKFEADFSSFGAPVTDVSDRNLSMGIPLANSFSVSEKLMPPHVELAGISGGGVFRLIERAVGNSVEGSLELAGIIYFGSAGLELVSAHPLGSLNPSGEFCE
jgi:hypothetical protein